MFSTKEDCIYWQKLYFELENTTIILDMFVYKRILSDDGDLDCGRHCPAKKIIYTVRKLSFSKTQLN